MSALKYWKRKEDLSEIIDAYQIFKKLNRQDWGSAWLFSHLFLESFFPQI